MYYDIIVITCYTEKAWNTRCHRILGGKSYHREFREPGACFFFTVFAEALRRITDTVYVHVCVYVCMYTYIYIYIYT